MRNPAIELSEAAQIIANRQRFFANSGIPETQVALIKSDYSGDDYNQYKVVNEPGEYQITRPNDGIKRSDGIATKTPGIGLFLQLADCLGIVIWDPVQKCLMVVHAGRHNLEQNGPTHAVEFLHRQCHSTPADLQVWLSPSAGRENYPLFAFENKSIEQVAREQLIAAGVKVENIISADIDTTTDENYFSHSQGDTHQRFAILAYIK